MKYCHGKVFNLKLIYFTFLFLFFFPLKAGKANQIKNKHFTFKAKFQEFEKLRNENLFKIKQLKPLLVLI